MLTRFAPSPTGELHLGHAFSAILAHDAARAAGGTFRLRIDDIDGSRSREAFVGAALADIEWLGLTFDGAPVRQSQHLGDYAAALADLRDRGLVYPCFCTRADIAASFQQAAVDCVTDRLRIALAGMDDVDTLVVAGGVAANATVRAALEQLAAAHGMHFAAPPPKLCTDNAAMIAWAGIERLGQDDPLDISARHERRRRPRRWRMGHRAGADACERRARGADLGARTRTGRRD
jgi:hypothetical protein